MFFIRSARHWCSPARDSNPPVQIVSQKKVENAAYYLKISQSSVNHIVIKECSEGFEPPSMPSGGASATTAPRTLREVPPRFELGLRASKARVITATLWDHISLHRAGFEPAPPKRVGLESTALDHSAIDALQNTIGAVSIHTQELIDKKSILDLICC